MSYRPVPRLSRVLARAVAVAAVLAALPARAQDPATVRRIEQMNKRAMEDYDLLEFDSARKTLTDAVALVRSSGLEEGRHILAAKTYINLGVVYIGGFKDKDRGRMAFVRGLKINADVRLEPQLATPELQDVFNEALREIGKRPDKPPTPPTPPPDVEQPGKEVQGLVHEPIFEARANFPLVIKCEVGADISAARVILFYRGTGREDFTAVPMTKNNKGVYTGEIPADAMTGKVIQYYIEVRDQRDRPQVANGSAGSPNIVSILESAGDGSTPNIGVDKENPLGGTIRKKPEQETPTGPIIRGRRFWLTVGFGTGFGLASGKSECAWDEGEQQGKNYSGYCATWEGVARTEIQSGFAPAPLHLAPEVGFYLGKRFALSLQGRIQVLTLARQGSATGSIAAIGRGMYFFGTERTRYYLAFAAGGGYIRHRVNLGKVATQAEEPIKSEDIVDTVRAGPILFGPCAGVYYEFSKIVGLQAEVNALAGVPEATFNFDINFGLNLNF